MAKDQLVKSLKKSQTTATLAINPAKDDFICRDDIKHLFNGYARIIEYGTNHIDKRGRYNPTIDSGQNFVISMTEGQFKNGLICGFSRCHDMEGECKIGYWKIEKSTEKV